MVQLPKFNTENEDHRQKWFCDGSNLGQKEALSIPLNCTASLLVVYLVIQLFNV